MRVLASCDSNYFLAFGRTFYTSAILKGYDPIINVINPTEEVLNLSFGIPNIDFTYSSNNRYTYYASNRFIIAPKYIEDGLLISDIDSIFRNPFPTDDMAEMIKTPMGLCIRPGRGLPEILAGLVWYNGSKISHHFAEKASALLDELCAQDVEWGVDQTILTSLYRKLKKKYCYPLRVSQKEQAHMSYRMAKNACIWTGKGTAKYLDNTYLNYTKEINDSSIDVFGSVRDFEHGALEKTKGSIDWHSPLAFLPREEMLAIKRLENEI